MFYIKNILNKILRRSKKLSYYQFFTIVALLFIIIAPFVYIFNISLLVGIIEKYIFLFLVIATTFAYIDLIFSNKKK